MDKAQVNSIVKMIKKSRAESGDESNNSAAQTEKKASFQLSSKPEKVGRRWLLRLRLRLFAWFVPC